MPPVISALIAGNTVVLKPSEITAASGVLMEELFKRVPELAPYVRVLHGDGTVGAALVKAVPDYIFITGSTATGKKVMEAAAENLIPVGFELGGKDPVIILEDAVIDQAARWSAWGSAYNAGQTCMAVERVYVVESAYNEFVRRAVEYTKQLKIGYSPDRDNPYYVGPMTDPRQVRTIERQLDDVEHQPGFIDELPCVVDIVWRLGFNLRLRLVFPFLRAVQAAFQFAHRGEILVHAQAICFRKRKSASWARV
jgi:acyl-CoA reductase-like NAD-dependent aldehyde dehydrogenase